MQFMITRTSVWDDDVPPCGGAVRRPYLRMQSWGVASFAEFDAQYPQGPWTSKGINHRVVDGYVQRDFEDSGWFINVADLDHLLQLSEQIGELVLSVDSQCPVPTLEIYDDYRE